MANWNKDDLAYDNQSTRFEVMMVANSSGVIFDKFPIEGGVSYQPPIGANTFNSNASTDAFGRLRVSNPFTLFDSTNRYGDDNRNWSTSNTAGSSYTSANSESSIFMTVGSASGQKVIRQTKRAFLYQPGKSLLTLNTVVMNTGKAGLRQRVGNFNDRDGIFFELADTTAYIVKRTGVSGSPQDIGIPQSQWNVDPLNGSGPSGITLNVDKAQIFWTDIEWLGVGSVRAGFVINGQFVVCHVFHHANSANSVYMTTASLPIRYEIENTANTASSSTLKHICNSVISEGGFTPTVLTRSISTALAGLAMSQTVYRPLVAIRLKAGREGAIAVPTTAEAYGLQTTPFNYKILQGCTITGGTWVSAGPESSVEYNVTATALTGGRNLMQGMFIGGTHVLPRVIDLATHDSAMQLRYDHSANTREVFCLAALATTNNDDALGSLVWSEFN